MVDRVERMLGLESIRRDSNIQREQFYSCCRHLLADIRNIGSVDLKGCRVRVARFYMVMSDGQICIPYDWKGAYDEDNMYSQQYDVH